MSPRKSIIETNAYIKNKYSLLPYNKIKIKYDDKSLSLDEDQCYIANIELAEERYRYDNTQNPISALTIFVKCIENRCYPPSDILILLSEKYKEYLESDKSIDEILKLGKNAKRAYSNDIRNMQIVTEIDTLRHYFDISLSHAINAVARRFEEDQIKLSYSSIQDIYDREGKRELRKSLMYVYDDIPWLDEMPKEYKEIT